MLLQCIARLLQCDTSLLQRDATLIQCDATLLQHDAILIQYNVTPIQCCATLIWCDATLLQRDAILIQCDALLIQCNATLISCPTTLLWCDACDYKMLAREKIDLLGLYMDVCQRIPSRQSTSAMGKPVWSHNEQLPPAVDMACKFKETSGISEMFQNDHPMLAWLVVGLAVRFPAWQQDNSRRSFEVLFQSTFDMGWNHRFCIHRHSTITQSSISLYPRLIDVFLCYL